MTFAILSVFLSVGQFLVPAFTQSAGAAGLSTNFFDYSNHDVATTGAGLVDWANNGALTSSTTTGSTWSRAGSQGIFDGGVYNGANKPPTAPGLTAAAQSLKASGAIQSAAFMADPLSSDTNWSCNGTTVSGDTTTFTGAGSEKNNGDLNTFTYGSAGNTPPKDDLSNVYAVSHAAPNTNEIFFGGERVVNNGASHIDFEFLQAGVTIPNPCAAGTMSGHRTQRDLLLSVDFTNGGTLGSAQLYSWSCNGIAPGAAGYDASKDGTICDPSSNPGAQYVAVPSQNNGVTIASFGVNSAATPITCGGWVCRDGMGAATTTLQTNELMEGGIDLNAAGFTGCINTFLPHTRSSQTFTATLKDFAGPLKFSNCKTPTISTQQSSAGVTSNANITVGIGSSVTDTATLHGAAASVGGTVSYKLYSDANCTTQVADAGTKTVSGSPDNNGDLVLPASNAVPVNTAGTYYWQASYSGDIASHGFNEPATSNCGDEVLTVVAPSLSITKTADNSLVSAGDPIGFTITLNNNGQGTATGVTITDPLPTGSGVNWSISPTVNGCSITSNNLTCNVGSLAPSGSVSVHITSPTVRASCGVYNNVASAQATNNATVQSLQATVTVQCPNLSITKTADAASVSAGTNIGFTITVNNAGPGTAKSVTLSDPLPSGSGISWSMSPAVNGCSINAGSLSCNFGDIASGGSASVHVTSPTVFASCATYPNTASAQATNNPQVQAQASTTVQCPGLNITKTADAASVSAGDNIGFTVTVSNSGQGTATGVTLSDPLPAGNGVNWSISPAAAGCTINGSAPNQTLSCSFGDLVSGASKTVHVTSATANASCGAYPNTATASATNQSSVQAQATTTVNCPDLHITKTADAASVSAGSNIGFTITVNNTGVGTAKAATLNDPLPTGAGISWSINPAYAGPGSCNIASNTLTCSFGDLASGASASVHIVSATTIDTPCTTYNNTATAQATNNPQVQASASTTVLCPALHVTKTADEPTVNAGDNIGFTVTVQNTGAGTATAVTLTDPLPGGGGVNWSISPAAAGCSISGSAPNQTLNCSFGDLASGASKTVHVMSATVRASCAEYDNTAIAAASNAASAQASASIVVQCPNLAITKTADASSVSAGSNIGFTIHVSNAGPGVAKSATMSDPLPGGAGINWSISPAVQGCSITGSAPNQTLNCNLGDMASGASASVHVISATTVDTPCASYPNTATAQATNNPQVQAQASTSVQCPGLHITKTADAPTVNAGDSIGFTIVVSNTGVGTATGVTLSDPLPSGAGISWSIDPAVQGCTINSGTLTCNFGDMASGASHSVHVTSATSFASCATYPNTATASATNSASVQAQASTQVECPDLHITKTADAGTVSAGDNIGFTITVNNMGLGVARSVTLNDPLPSGGGVSWSIDPAVQGCTINSGTLTCNFGDMASGASHSVHVTSGTTSDSCKQYDNTATASATNEPNAVEASASTTVQCAHLSITKTADASPVSTGDSIGFSITVTNSAAAGTGTAKAVTLSDPLPGGNGVDWSINPAYAGPGSCSISGSAPNQSLDCSFGDMAPGASISVHIMSGTTKDSAGSYPNTATASASNTDSVQASATIVVLPPALSITKTADATPVNTGDAIGFTVTVSNSAAQGTGTAKGVTLSDPLPGGTGVDWSISPAYAGPGTCSISGSAPNQSLDCSFGDMAPGASVSVHIMSGTTKDSAGSYPNTATASASNTDSVQASATIVVQPPALSITKTADAQTVSANDTIGFTITVSNAGPGIARSATLNDPLPTNAGTSWSIDPAYAGQGTCAISNNTLTCNYGDLLAGSSASVHVSSTTTSATCGTVNNTATVSATNDGSHDASASTTVECPDLTLNKTADNATVNAGETIGFTISAHNAGPGVAKSVTLSDPLPAGTDVSWSVTPAVQGCSIANGTLSCNFGDLASGGDASVHVSSDTTFNSCQEYPNTATLNAANSPELHAQASTTVECPSLSITKTADATPVNTGDPIGFTVTVSNGGPGIAKGVQLNDPMPAGNGVDWKIDTSDPTCQMNGSAPSQTLACTFGDLDSDASVSVHIISDTTAASAGTYPNTATATSTNAPTVDASATIDVLAPALSITKTADNSKVSAGDNIGFTMTVSNLDGENIGIARSVTLTDPLPAGKGVSWSIDPAYAGPGTCDITGAVPDQVLGCAFGDMAPGASASVHVSSKTTDASAGTYPNTATASATNAPSVDASATITVIAPTPVTTAEAASTTTTTVASPAQLPFTGSNGFGLALFGGALVLGGGALALSRRRRNRAMH